MRDELMHAVLDVPPSRFDRDLRQLLYTRRCIRNDRSRK
jgi:hypothetical protein